jgi:hypothetical protein
MNELTKFLIKELLDEPQTVAIYGGGFKPPTKGHFTVAEQTLEQFPEIDELKIFVGVGVRNGIPQKESLAVWNIYKNYLSDKVNVEPSPQGEPKMDVIRYAREHPEEKIYWILGARDGDKEDIKDVEQGKNLLKKYPEVTNVEVKVITSTGGISGTKTRQALKAGDKEQFFQLIPDIEEKEQIWDIISPVVKEEITPDQVKQADTYADKQLAPVDVDLTSKHVFDRLTSRDSDVTLAQLIGFFKRLGQNKKEFFDFFKKYKEIVATDKRTNLNIPFLNMTNKAIAKTIMRKDNFMSSSPKLVFEVGEANLKPYKWKEVDVDGWVTYVEFTTESETEYSVDIATVPYFDNDLNNYKALEIEFLAKPKDAQGSSAKIIVNKGELYRVMATITDIIKYYVKKFKAKAISYSPSKKSDEEDFGSQRDNLYRAFISKAIPGVRFEKNSNFITAILPDKALNEGRYDSITNRLSKLAFKAFKDIYDNGDKKGEFFFTVGPDDEDIQSDEFEFDYTGVVEITDDEYMVDGGANVGFDDEGEEITPSIVLKFRIPQNPDWQQVSFDIKDVVRHELEYLTQDGLNLKGTVDIDDPRAQNNPKLTRPGKYMQDDQFVRDMIDMDLLPKADYFRLEKEVDAMLQGMYLKAKKSRTPFKDVINDYFEKVGLEGEDKQDILDLWTKRLKALNSPAIQETDMFGLNELAKTFVKETFEKAWNLQDGMLSLSKYMMDNGMNIKPLPKIKVIKDDEENASHLLGKTAYYDPNNKSITLYTMNRHPKDVLRSFAHEMIHHEQNLEGRLNNINTTNTNEDGDLPEIEKEAYEKGNMMLRNWEDSIKNV